MRYWLLNSSTPFRSRIPKCHTNSFRLPCRAILKYDAAMAIHIVILWALLGSRLNQSLKHWTRPTTASLPVGTLADTPRSRRDLLAENALLRRQPIVFSGGRSNGRNERIVTRFDWCWLASTAAGSMRCLVFRLAPYCAGITTYSTCTGDTNREKGRGSDVLPPQETIARWRLKIACECGAHSQRIAQAGHQGQQADISQSEVEILVNPGPPSSKITLPASGHAISPWSTTAVPAALHLSHHRTVNKAHCPRGRDPLTF
jgi:hypothetical protein